MKKLIFIFILLSTTAMFSAPSYSEWTKVSEIVDGDVYYVDFERKRKNDGYDYYWQLTDYTGPTELGDLSSIIYVEGDCKLFRYKYLSYSFHQEPMGGGAGIVDNVPDINWTYPAPNSVTEVVLMSVCSR